MLAEFEVQIEGYAIQNTIVVMFGVEKEGDNSWLKGTMEAS